MYGTWCSGQDYRGTSKLYGAYPPGYLDRVMALFPDVKPGQIQRGLEANTTMHVFSGSLPKGPYVRLDINPDHRPDFIGSVYDVAEIFDQYLGWFELIIADPPYSAADAEKYGTAMVNRGRAMSALAQVTRAGGHLVWLDTVWPMHRKDQWLTVGRISLVRSTNHRVRMVTIFERQGLREFNFQEGR